MSFNNSIPIDTQSWFIPIDILQIICSSFAIILAILFLFIIIFDKTCHTIPMMLVAHSCLAELLLGYYGLSMTIFTFRNDLKQIYYYDISCIIYGCIGYFTVQVQNYSYLLQAIYRYITVVYPNRLFVQSVKFQLFLIILTWICGIIYSIPLILTNQIKYHADNQICQMEIRLSFITIFSVSYVYLIPMSFIILIYFKMVLYVKEMSKHVVSANRLFHARRELKMIRRIVLLISVLISLGLPYTIFIFMSFFNRAPRYHFRIAYIFVHVSLVFIMIALFQITDPLKRFVVKKLTGQTNMVEPIGT